jgi:hypothetical protein
MASHLTCSPCSPHPARASDPYPPVDWDSYRSPSPPQDSTCWALHSMRTSIKGRICPFGPWLHTRGRAQDVGITIDDRGAYSPKDDSQHPAAVAQDPAPAAPLASTPDDRTQRTIKAQRLARAWRLKRRCIIRYWMQRLDQGWCFNMKAHLWRIKNPIARKVMTRYAWQLRSLFLGFRHGW